MPSLAFYHPEMQETLLVAAEQAGAEVRRGVRAKNVTPGPNPAVTVENNGATEDAQARLVVGVDGRGSLVRKWAGFAERQDGDRLLIGGLLFDNSNAPDDTVRFVSDFARGRGTIIFPQGDRRVRTYLICGVGEGMRLQGDNDIPRFIEESVASGMPQEYFDGARPAGPLATFEGADCWVDHPYRDGVALVGDAAASSDPSWGQGLSLTLRDVRVLRDALLANDDWEAAGHAYATEHDRYFGILHTVEDWLTRFFFETGPEAEASRARGFPLIAQEPERVPDALFSGPDQPVDETMRRRFFGEE
jgi:2-polyprenyl-6-methoxyphenol hydroxylase-like FAD-dependent oxidoreductase